MRCSVRRLVLSLSCLVPIVLIALLVPGAVYLHNVGLDQPRKLAFRPGHPSLKRHLSSNDNRINNNDGPHLKWQALAYREQYGAFLSPNDSGRPPGRKMDIAEKQRERKKKDKEEYYQRKHETVQKMMESTVEAVPGEDMYRKDTSNLPSKCMSSPRLHDDPNMEWFSNKFVDDIPVLMTSPDLSVLEYERLMRFPIPYGLGGISLADLQKAVTSLPLSEGGALFGDRSGCRRCAVVGNGGSLKGAGLGDDIDGHDYVFRVNRAVTAGHETDVGVRTSFYFFTVNTLLGTLQPTARGRQFHVPTDRGIKYILTMCDRRDYTLVDTLASGTRVDAHGVDQLAVDILSKLHLGSANVRLLHPDLLRYINNSWLKSKKRRYSVYRPSTGAIAAFAALQTCDEVSLYGFGRTGGHTVHYYDNATYDMTTVVNHDFPMEWRLWRKLAQLGVVRLLPRQPQ